MLYTRTSSTRRCVQFEFEYIIELERIELRLPFLSQEIQSDNSSVFDGRGTTHPRTFFLASILRFEYRPQLA